MKFKVGKRELAVVTVCVSLCACMLLMVSSALGESLTGRWAAYGQKMDNGEQQKAILDLTQTGTDLKGKMTALGFRGRCAGQSDG